MCCTIIVLCPQLITIPKQEKHEQEKHSTTSQAANTRRSHAGMGRSNHMCCGQLTPLLSWQTATPHAWHHQLSQGRNSPRKEESHTKCQPASPQLAPQPAFFLPCSFLACNTALTNLILNHYHTGALHAWTREREERGGKTEQKRSAKGTHISIKYTHSSNLCGHYQLLQHFSLITTGSV